jgi:hypothetical protein
MDTTNVELLVLAGLGVWIGTVVFVSRIGGWAALATVYGYSGELTGKYLRFQSGRLRWGINYGNCLTVGVSPRGLYLAVLFFFRIGHPPLLIPWTDISVSEQKGRWFSYLELRFRRASSIPLQVSEQLGRWLTDRAGPAWPARGQASSQ